LQQVRVLSLFLKFSLPRFCITESNCNKTLPHQINHAFTRCHVASHSDFFRVLAKSIGPDLATRIEKSFQAENRTVDGGLSGKDKGIVEEASKETS
jgi:hypothetical protein